MFNRLLESEQWRSKATDRFRHLGAPAAVARVLETTIDIWPVSADQTVLECLQVSDERDAA